MHRTSTKKTHRGPGRKSHRIRAKRPSPKSSPSPSRSPKDSPCPVPVADNVEIGHDFSHKRKEEEKEEVGMMKSVGSGKSRQIHDISTSPKVLPPPFPEADVVEITKLGQEIYMKGKEEGEERVGMMKNVGSVKNWQIRNTSTPSEVSRPPLPEAYQVEITKLGQEICLKGMEKEEKAEVAKIKNMGPGKSRRVRAKRSSLEAFPPLLESYNEEITTLRQEIRIKGKEKEKAVKMKNVGSSETGKAVYLFLDNYGDSYNHTLYAVDLPNNLEDAPLDSGPIQLSPILAFKSGEYPDHMCCVEVEGKLYFVGGNLMGCNDGFFPKDVHIFDPLTASLDKPLTKGPEMNTGKCFPFAFVVGRDIYVLSQNKVFNQSMFEVLRADASGHYAQWEILEEPPFETIRMGDHVVIGARLFMSEFRDFYDTVSGKWSTSNQYAVELYKRAHSVDGCLYTCLNVNPYTVSSYESIHLPQSKRLWSLNIWDCLIFPDSRLAYIGDRIFCHVLYGSPGDPDYPGMELPNNHFLSLTIFKASTERNYGKQVKRTHFRSYLLHCMHFANKDISSDDSSLGDCFVLPSCGIKQDIEGMVFSRIPIIERLKLQLGLLQK